MKICFVVGTLARGGAEKQLVFMLRALRQTGIDAEILCLTRGESYEAEIEKLGFNVRWVGAAKNRLARLWAISAALLRNRADVVQSSHFYTNIYAAAAGKLLKIKSIGAIRSDLTYEADSHRITGDWQISLPHLLMTNSRLACRRLAERGVSPEKIELVRNAVEIPKRVETARSSGSQPLNILFAGRLDKNKRPDRFVRLAFALTKNLPHVPLRFQIAGDGELRNETEKLARRLDLSPRTLSFLGACPKMNEIYAQADILISTSESEGMPNVVLEAMAHGLPVAATNVGGTTELLGENRGFLFEPNDEGEMFSAARQLILNEELRRRLGAEGRRYAAENHSLDCLQKHLPAVYEKLIRTAART